MNCKILPGLLTLFLIKYTSALLAQNVRINTDGSAAHASALLDIKSSDKGILLPSVTAAQRSAIVNPAKGLIVFQTDALAGFCYYDGIQWVSLTNDKPLAANGFTGYYSLVSNYSGDTANYIDGPLNVAQFNQPRAITTDRAGNIYVLDFPLYNVRKISANGFPRVTTIAGGNVIGYKDDSAAEAQFNAPFGITVDASYNIYVADYNNNRIRKVSQSGVVTTLAGNSTVARIDGVGTAASFFNPFGIVADPAGNLYVSEFGNNAIRKISPDGTVITIAGFSGAGYADGPAAGALFHTPAGLAMDAAGNLYIADRDNYVIRKMTPAGIVSTYAGTGVPGVADGPASAAEFYSPTGIAVDLAGNVYVSDVTNFNIRKITPEGIVTTLAGFGSTGNENGYGTAAGFGHPAGLTIDKDGNLLVADGINHRIRKIILQ